VIFLIDLSGCVLLGFLLWRHRELFFSWNHGGRQCWGPKIGWSPQTQGSDANTWKSRRGGGQGIPESLYSSQKFWIPLHVPSDPPFIGRRRDFYIPRLPSNLKNIPSVNTYMNVLYIPWFVGLISYIYRPATSSHFKPELFEMTSLTWPPIDSRGLIHEDLHSSRLANLDSLIFPKSSNSCLTDFAGFHSPWNIQPTYNPRSIRRSSRTMLEDSQIMQNRQHFFANISLLWSRFSALRHIHEYYLWIRQLWRSKGERFLPNSPTLWF
jgi:hypothetical protein